MDNKLITSFYEYSQGANPSEEGMKSAEMVDPSIIEKLVDIVGSEEDVEGAAKEAFEELKSSFEKNEIELKEEDAPEALALSALILKLVELGKIGPQEADSFIQENIAKEDVEEVEGEEETTETNEWRSYRRFKI